MDPQSIYQIIKENLRKISDNLHFVIFVSLIVTITNAFYGYLFDVEWINNFITKSSSGNYSLMVITMFILDILAFSSLTFSFIFYNYIDESKKYLNLFVKIFIYSAPLQLFFISYCVYFWKMPVQGGLLKTIYIFGAGISLITSIVVLPSYFFRDNK